MWLFVFTQSATFHNKVEPIIIFYSPYSPPCLWHRLKNKKRWRVCKGTSTQHWERRRISLLLKVARAGAGCVVSDWCEEVCGCADSWQPRTVWRNVAPGPTSIRWLHCHSATLRPVCQHDNMQLNISIYLQDNRLLEVQGCWQHSEGIQAQHPDRHRLQGSRIAPQLLLQIHLLQKGSYLSSLTANWTRAITLIWPEPIISQ